MPPGNFDREVKLCFNAARNNTQEMIFGCEESDFQGNFNNTLVILYRGKCKFEDKITNANKANAAGVIVINNNPTGVITMSIGGKTCCSNSLLWAHCLGCPQSK